MSNISNSHAPVVDQEQLFTELNAEEASVIEGGLFLLIDQIQAIRAGADTFSNDDTYITVNGNRIWGEGSLSSGSTASVNRGLGVGNRGRIALFDADWPDDDDYLGGFDVTAPTNGQRIQRVSGSGSTYDVYYQVF